MAAYRVTCKPDKYKIAGLEYDVEEQLEMSQASSFEKFLYWSFLEGPFATLEEADDYVGRLLSIGNDRVTEGYR
jgi:hypothetical protein